MERAGDGVSDGTYDPARHYDRVTAAWTLLLGDDLHYGMFDDSADELATATQRLTDTMAAAANLSPRIEVLDVGCGTGAPACFLAATYGARVTGITTSPVGVDAARARASALGLMDLVRFEQRDGMDNHLSAASFDRVWVLESSHLMRQRDRLIAECARVLRPSGRLVLCDIMLRRPMLFEEVRRRLVALSLLRRVFGDSRMEQLSVYADLARANGLIVEQAVDLTAATRPTFARWRQNAQRHRDEVVLSLGQTGWNDFVESCSVLEGFWDDGTLGYGLLAASRP